jgi:DNA-binding MarR family transcriptional regulator
MNKDDGNAPVQPLADIDRLVHEPARLAILSLLYVVESSDFIFLMNQTGLSWGNLSAHMAKLEDAGYLQVEKTFKEKRPKTTLRLTDKGRRAFRGYAIKMKQALDGLDL